MKLTFCKLRDKAAIPQRATAGSAGMDLCACLDEPVTLLPHEIRLIPTGLSAAPERSDVMLMICARSGLASKHGIALANGVGIVDADYRGEIGVIVVNLSNEPQTIENGERLCQMVVARHETVDWEAVDTLDSTQRGAGGFGHTGTK